MAPDSLTYIFLNAAIINNFVLALFLGICPFLGVSAKRETAFNMGLAVMFVMFVSSVSAYGINWLLVELEIEFLRLICYIAVIASAVQLVEMYVRKFSPSLYESFGIFLPLITTNCAILGLCLFLNLWGTDSLLEAVVLSFGGGIGFTIAICIMAGIRENLMMVDVPECLRGAPITLITAGILSLAFMGFAGII